MTQVDLQTAAKLVYRLYEFYQSAEVAFGKDAVARCGSNVNHIDVSKLVHDAKAFLDEHEVIELLER